MSLAKRLPVASAIGQGACRGNRLRVVVSAPPLCRHSSRDCCRHSRVPVRPRLQARAPDAESGSVVAVAVRCRIRIRWRIHALPYPAVSAAPARRVCAPATPIAVMPIVVPIVVVAVPAVLVPMMMGGELMMMVAVWPARSMVFTRDDPRRDVRRRDVRRHDDPRRDVHHRDVRHHDVRRRDASAAMTATAASEDGTGQQQAGQCSQSPANAENPRFRAAADDISPVRQCGVWRFWLSDGSLTKDFIVRTFLESGRSETRRNRKTSERDGAQTGRRV